MRERQELHRNILSTSLLSLLFAFVPDLLKCSNWSMLKCSGSVRAALPAALCCSLGCTGVAALLHYVLQCVNFICDFIAVKCRPKKKEDRYFLVITVIVFGVLDQFQSLLAPFSDFFGLVFL